MLTSVGSALSALQVFCVPYFNDDSVKTHRDEVNEDGGGRRAIVKKVPFE